MRDSVFYESQALLCRKLKKKPPQGSSAGPEGYQQRKTNIILSNGFQKWPKIAKNVKETLFQMANHYWTKSFELNIKRKWKLYLYFLFAPLRLLCHFFLFLLENAWTIWSFQSHYCKYVTSTTDQQELSIWPKCLGFWEVVAFLHLSQVFFLSSTIHLDRKQLEAPSLPCLWPKLIYLNSPHFSSLLLQDWCCPEYKLQSRAMSQYLMVLFNLALTRWIKDFVCSLNIWGWCSSEELYSQRGRT